MIRLARSKTLISTIALATALSVSTAVVVPDTSQALDFKKLGRNIKKDFKKAKGGFGKAAKDLNKSGAGKLIVQGIGIGLVANGIARDSPAALIIGVALVAAPEIFRNDMAKTYGNDMQWSGCTRCYKQRIVVAPGRNISDQKKSAVSEKVKEDVMDIQRALAKLGLYNRGIDGDFGNGSRKAVREFQTSLGTPATGYLTAEERYLLFTRAVEKGYVREAALDKIDDAEKTSVPTIPVVVAGPVIREYRLAQSQLGHFADDFLKTGTQSIVADAQLQPDGLITMDLKAAAGQPGRRIIANVQDLRIKPHDLSDQWIRIVYFDPTATEPVILNTRDDFASIDVAGKWMQEAQSKLSILAKLTGAEPEPGKGIIASEEPPTTNTPPVNVAAASPGETKAGSDGRIILAGKGLPEVQPVTPKVVDEAPEQPETIIAEAKPLPGSAPEPAGPALPVTGAAKAGSDGRIILADKGLPEIQPGTPKPAAASPREPETRVAEAKPLAPVAPEPEIAPASTTVAKAGTDGSIVLANTEVPAEAANSLSGFEMASTDRTCRQSIYVSFTFPDGDTPISHYNIEPPEGTIMMDNGDSTAYFTGSCVQGKYDYSYVHVEEAKAKEDWKHFEKDGSFEIASNNEQCSVDLNSPDGSASLRCF